MKLPREGCRPVVTVRSVDRDRGPSGKTQAGAIGASPTAEELIQEARSSAGMLTPGLAAGFQDPLLIRSDLIKGLESSLPFYEPYTERPRSSLTAGRRALLRLTCSPLPR